MSAPLTQPLLPSPNPPLLPTTKDSFPSLLSSLQCNISLKTDLKSCPRSLTDFQSGGIAGLDDGTIALFTSDQVVSVLGKHDGKVTTVRAMNQYAISASEDKCVKVWDVPGRKEVGKLEGHEAAITVLAVETERKVVVSGGKDGKVIVWRVDELCAVGSLNGHTDAVTCILVVPGDSKRWITASEDFSIKVWSAESFQLLSSLSGHTHKVWSIALTPDGSTLLSGSQDKSVKVWNVAEEREVATFAGEEKPVYKVSVALDGEFAFSAGNDDIKVYRLSTLTHVASLSHPGFITDILYTPNTKYFITATQKKTIKFWSFASLSEVATIEADSKRLTAVTLSADGKKLISGGQDNCVHVWDLRDERELEGYRGHEQAVLCLETIVGGRVISGTESGAMQVWTYDQLETVQHLPPHDSLIYGLSVSSDGSTALSSARDQTCKLWNLQDFTYTLLPQAHSGHISSVALRPDGKQGLTGALDRLIKVWDFENMTAIGELAGHTSIVWCLKYMKCGFRAVSGSPDCSVRVWDLLTFTEIAHMQGDFGFVSSILVSANDDFIVSGSNDGPLSLWDCKQKSCITTLRAHTSICTALVLLPNEDYFVSGSEDKTICLWSFLSMALLHRFETEGKIKSLAVTLDGKRVLYTNGNVVEEMDIYGETEAGRRAIRTEFEEGRLVAGRQRQTLLRVNLGRMTRGEEVVEEVAKMTCWPFGFNALHVSAYYNQAEALRTYLHYSVPIFSGCFGSPLTLALHRNARKCATALLLYLTQLSQCSSIVTEIQEISDDLPDLLSTNLPRLYPFFSSLFVAMKRDFLPELISPIHELPITQFCRGQFVRPELFAKFELGADKSERTLVQTGSEEVEYRVTLFRWTFAPGSEQSLRLLTALESCDDKRVLTTPLFSTLIQSKWDRFRPFTYLMTTLYVCLIAALVLMHFESASPTLLSSLFIALNILFLTYEIVQAASTGLGYICDIWNIIDIARGVLSLFWGLTVFMELEKWPNLHLAVASLTLFRGFTYFRTFQPTRMFVRMTLEVVKEMYAFLVIILYSTFSFGFLYSVLDPNRISTVAGSWTTAYELLMGNFDNEGFGVVQWMCFTAASFFNVIIMLNLLVSILGDAYSTAQERSSEHDFLEMLKVIIEYESMLTWHRSVNNPVFMLDCRSCDEEEGEEVGMEAVQEEVRRVEERLQAKIENLEKSLVEELRKIARSFQVKNNS